MKPKVVGPIFNQSASLPSDESLAVTEMRGPFILGDAKDVGRWLGTDHGGRWKTWVLGPLSTLPMIQWPKFDRFHQHRHEAEGAFVALKGAVEKSMPGAPIVIREGIGSSPESKFGMVYAQSQDPSEPGASPFGVLMMDGCDDYDFAEHMTPKLSCLRGGNYDGPRMVSFRAPEFRCVVATIQGINERTDHILLTHAPRGTDAAVDTLVQECLGDARPDPEAKPVRIDCMSGVIVALWSRMSGQKMLGHYDDPAMGLCNDGLVDAGGAMAVPPRNGEIDGRQAGPVAWSFIVNPGKWTARYWLWEHQEGADPLPICIFSRDGATSFHPDLDCSMPGVLTPDQLPPDPVASLKSRAAEVATERAADMVQDQIDDLLGPYMPAALLAQARLWATEKLWAVIGGCVTMLVGALILAVVLGFVAIVTVFKMVFG